MPKEQLINIEEFLKLSKEEVYNKLNELFFIEKDGMLRIYHLCDTYLVTPILLPSTEKSKSLLYYSFDLPNGDSRIIHERKYPNKDTYITISNSFIDEFDCGDFTHIHAEQEGLNINYYFHQHNHSKSDKPIIITNSNEVWISKYFLKHYLSMTEQALSLQFEYVYYDDTFSGHTPDLIETIIHNDRNMIIKRRHYDNSNYLGLSGKKIVDGFSNYNEDDYDMNYEKKEVGKFILSQNDDGGYEYLEITSGSYIRGDAELYSTLLYFKRDVLDKYINLPSVYTVEDNYIRGGNLNLKADTNHSEYVIVHAGRLSLLPITELKHWEAHSIPNKKDMSKAYFLRMIAGEWANPSGVDFVFKDAYEELNKLFLEKFSNVLWKPLNKEQEHEFNTLLILNDNEAKNFNDQMKKLAIILVDSINSDLLPKKENEKEGSISLLKRFLENNKYPHCDDFIKMLRNIQSIRSILSAHRQGSTISKEVKKYFEYFNIDEKDFKSSFSRVLETIVYQLRCLIDFIKNQQQIL